MAGVHVKSIQWFYLFPSFTQLGCQITRYTRINGVIKGFTVYKLGVKELPLERIASTKNSEGQRNLSIFFDTPQFYLGNVIENQTKPPIYVSPSLI